jgi:thiosulfate dehydrogenase [quinone] large subunit
MTNRQLAWHAMRLTLGLNILLHGLVRLPHLGAFVDGLVKMFADTPLPVAMVIPFGYVLPVAEAILGALLIVGRGLRYTVLAGMALMAVLEFGTALRSDWSTLSLQLGYSAIYALLLYCAPEPDRQG